MDSISSLEVAWYVLFFSWLIALFSAGLLRAFTMKDRWTHRSIFLGSAILGMGCLSSIFLRIASDDAGSFLGAFFFLLLVLGTTIATILGFGVGINRKKDWRDSLPKWHPAAR